MKIEAYSPTIRRKEMDAVLTAMVEDKIGPGERGRILIQTAKEHIGFDYALALRSPATALHLALKALNLQSSAEGADAASAMRGSPQAQGVLVSALSPRYYLNVIEDLQLTPLFCDVSHDNPCMTRETIEKAIAEKPAGLGIRCIVLHHTLGFLPDAEAIAQLGLPIIEDISQSYGTAEDEPSEPAAQGSGSGVDYKGTLHGSFIILGLEERDILTSGGGALLFSMNRRDGMALRNFSSIPYEYSLPDINAAMATVQFKELPKGFKRRGEIARIYIQSSMRARHKRFIPLKEGMYNNYAFPLALEAGLKDVVAYARKKEIIVESAFEQTLAGAGISQPARCPVSHSLSLRTVLFPLYPRLSSQEAERVSKLIMTLP